MQNPSLLSALPVCFPDGWDGDQAGYDRHVKPLVMAMTLENLQSLCRIAPTAKMILELSELLPEFAEIVEKMIETHQATQTPGNLSLKRALEEMFGDSFREPAYRVTLKGRKEFWKLFEKQLTEMMEAELQKHTANPVPSIPVPGSSAVN